MALGLVLGLALVSIVVARKHNGGFNNNEGFQGESRSLSRIQRRFGNLGAALGRIGSLSSFYQGINGELALFGGVLLRVRNLAGQESDLSLLGIGRSSVGAISAEGSSGSQSGEKQGPYLNAVRETRLRFLIGIPLFLFGVWLINYCDRTIKGDFGRRGWLLWSSAAACIAISFILLLYRDSLSSLKDLF